MAIGRGALPVAANPWEDPQKIPKVLPRSLTGLHSLRPDPFYREFVRAATQGALRRAEPSQPRRLAGFRLSPTSHERASQGF